MILTLLFLICSEPCLSSNPSSTMNLAELSSVQYNMEIDKEPVVEMDKKDSSQLGPSLTMVNMKGQKYRCSLPQVPDSVTVNDTSGEALELDVAKLLSPLEAAPCIFVTKDWWTYEVCYNRAIKQYHVEGDTAVGAVIVLGVHNPALDSWGRTNETYQPQWYGNGSRCDLTGKLRQTELRFVCNEAAVQEFVGDIFEHQSCEYRIVVHTSKVCGVPWLKTVAVTTPLSIVCHPVLSQLEMDQFKLYEERRKLVLQLQLKQRKQKQAVQLVQDLKHDEWVKGLAGGFGTVDSMMEVMGAKMMGKIFGEINTLLENNLVDFAGGKKNAGGGKGTSPSVSISKSTVNKKLNDKRALLDSGGKKVSEANLHGLIGNRKKLGDQIFEASITFEQYKGELLATEQHLFHLKLSAENKERIENLELKWRSLDMTLRSIQAHVAKLKSQEKSFTRRISSLKNSLKVNSYSEVLTNDKDLNKVTGNVHKEFKLPVVLDRESEATPVANDHGYGTSSDGSKKHENIVSEDSVNDFGENIRISIIKHASTEDPEEYFDEVEAENIATYLEGLVKHKLSEHNLAKTGKVVQVKVITTRMPEGPEDAEDWQVQGMFYNMMTGNLLGFEDIDSVMRDEENYGFIWREEMLNNIDKMIFSLREDGVDTDLDNNMSDYAISQDEDIFNYWKERNKGKGYPFKQMML
eukprot:GFUD01040042.1.p1 GENE.GFUD01040042.1~~GFUD01040042.1.p1  ORF type:complete len:690 (+),score=189.07 GFUD01040042.1:86-2155(+)